MRVDGWVDKADGGLAVDGELLVDERDVGGPHGRGKAGSAVGVGGAGGLVGADVEGEVGVGGNVRAVAIGGGTLVGGGDDAGELSARREWRLSGLMPPPLSTQAVSELQGPPALAVTRSVPPTVTTLASSAGQG